VGHSRNAVNTAAVIESPVFIITMMPQFWRTRYAIRGTTECSAIRCHLQNVVIPEHPSGRDADVGIRMGRR
jgi:hypothetical protein